MLTSLLAEGNGDKYKYLAAPQSVYDYSSTTDPTPPEEPSRPYRAPFPLACWYDARPRCEGSVSGPFRSRSGHRLAVRRRRVVEVTVKSRSRSRSNRRHSYPIHPPSSGSEQGRRRHLQYLVHPRHHPHSAQIPSPPPPPPPHTPRLRAPLSRH